MTAVHTEVGGQVEPARGPATRTRALFLLNAKARNGRCYPAAAVERLGRAGFELVEKPVDRPHLMSQVVREHRDRVDAVIIGGGDGTLSAAADGLVDAQLPLGILPLGTANDLARTLGLPIDPTTAADVICQGHQRRIDLGWVNGTHFFNVGSVGVGAGVTRALSQESKGRWGACAYVFAAARVAFHARPFAAEIRTGTEELHIRTIQVTVGNGRYYGGGLTVDETARIDDGLLHLYSLEIEHWWQIIPLLPALRRGTLRSAPHVRTLQGHEFEVRPKKKKGKMITADGEFSGRTPAHFKVVPRALSVFAPEG
jgi:YegS/Rv2252/BmrU family lipid kinase